MAKSVIAYGFKGMNNLPRAAARLLDDERQLTPRIVLNADVTDGGVLQRRGGYRQTASLSSCHSLWADSVMLCAAQGFDSPQGLYKVEGPQALELCTIPGPVQRVSFAEINNLVYAATPYWPGVVYDPAAETVRPWGVSLPPAPEINLVEGDLPPGTYVLCYTNTASGQLGGNGPLVQISWEGMSRGIELLNRPAGALCWITQPNGKQLFMAPLAGEMVTGQTPLMQPLPTFAVQPPPGFSHFVFAFGRIWGARGKKICYSDPHQYEWFRTSNYLPFLEDLVLLAPVTGGIFASSRARTWFLEGTDPAKMGLRTVGDGAVPGTMVMAQVEGGGYEISRKLAQLPSPVWMSPRGLVVGTHTGHVVHLTEARVRLNPRTQGAGLYRVKDGIPQVLVSLYGQLQEEDLDLLRLFEEGKIFN
jgi:hypothetical protein